MITKAINPQNKRAYQLNLTVEGEKALEKWDEHCLEIEQISLKGFSEKRSNSFKNIYLVCIPI